MPPSSEVPEVTVTMALNQRSKGTEKASVYSFALWGSDFKTLSLNLLQTLGERRLGETEEVEGKCYEIVRQTLLSFRICLFFYLPRCLNSGSKSEISFVFVLSFSLTCRDVIGPGPEPEARRAFHFFPGPTRPEARHPGPRAWRGRKIE